MLDEQFNPKNVLQKVPINKDILELVTEVRDFDESEDTEQENGLEVAAKLGINIIDQYVASLKDAAKFWYITHFPYTDEITDPERIWLDKLNRISIGYFRPLVLSSFTNKKVTPQQRVSLFKAIERFIFLAFRMNRTQSNWASSGYYRIAKELYWEETTIDQIISSLESDLNWMFDEESGFLKSNGFYEYIHKKFHGDGSGFYGWNALRYFLFEYEEFIRPTKRGAKLVCENLKNEGDLISIEHILPQTDDNPYWKKEFKSIPKKQRELLKGSLGNLLSLSSSINSSLQNDSFPDKREVKKNDKGKTIRNGYKNGSFSEQKVAEYDNWNADAISERGLELLEFLEIRWNVKFENEEVKLKLLHLE